MVRWLIVTLAAMALSAGLASAQQAFEFKAGALAAVCAPPAGLTADQKGQANILCDGFLQGLTQGMTAMQVAQIAGIRVCLPSDASLSPNDAKRILLQELQLTPSLADSGAGPIAAGAIIKRYMCPKS